MASSEKNFSQATSVDRKISGKITGRVKIKHAKVAFLIERGDPVPVVAQETGLTAGRIYHLLEDENSFVNAEIARIRKEKYSAQERLLANIREKEVQLHYKALQYLESMIESQDKGERNKAIDQITKTIVKNRKAADQLEKGPYTFDDFVHKMNNEIIAKRKERGLPIDPDEKDS
jgi:DNA-binding protein H-NS